MIWDVDDETCRFIWDVVILRCFWDVFEMLLTWVLLLHSWLCRIHCIFKMELMLVEMACIGEFWDEGYALLMPLLIGKFLRWEFCSNGTTCICIVLSRVIWLHREVCIDVVSMYVLLLWLLLIMRWEVVMLCDLI